MTTSRPPDGTLPERGVSDHAMTSPQAAFLALSVALAIAALVAVGLVWVPALSLAGIFVLFFGGTGRSGAPLSRFGGLFLIALFAAGKDLSQIGIPLRTLTLYSGELVLVGLLGSWVLLRARNVVGPPLRDPITWAASGLFLLGLTKAAVLGFQMDEYGLRQLAMLAYLGWIPIGYLMAQQAAELKATLWAMALASCILVIVGLVNVASGHVLETTTTGTHRYIPGYAALYSIIGLAVAANVRPPRWVVPARLWRWFVAISAITAVILAQHRSSFLAAAAVLALSLPRRVHATRALLALGAAFTVATSILVLGLATSQELREIAETMAIERIASVTDLRDPNTAWRLASAAEVGSVVVRHPLGIGFGFRQFTFNLDDPYVASHNSYLDFALRFGVDGLLLAFFLFFTIFARLRRGAELKTDRGQLAQALSGAMAGIGIVAAFNVVFQTPYMGPLPWFFLGAGWGYLRATRNGFPDPPRFRPR